MIGKPWVFGFGLGLASLAISTHASADARECVRQHAAGQDASRDAKLLHARQAFLSCVSADCPAEVRDECVRLSQAIDNRIPSVVIAFTNSAGEDIVSAQVLVDGKEVAKQVDGRPIALDPGIRQFELRAGDSVVKSRVVIREGEKNRPLVFRAEAAPKQPGAHPARPVEAARTSEGGVPAAAWIAGGVGVVGLGAFGYFAVLGRNKEKDLDSCTPYCSQDEYDSMTQRYLIADIALGVGVVALGTAAVLVLTAPRSEVSAVASVSAAPGGGRLQLQGAF